MYYRIIKPSGILARYVKFYWILEQIEDYPCHYPFRVIPNGMSELIFHFGDDYYCLNADNAAEKEPAVSICGQKSRYFDVIAPGTEGFLSVVFKPYGTAAFFPFQFSEIVNSNADLDSVYPNETRLLQEQIEGCTGTKEKIRYVETFLISKFKPEKRKHMDLMENLFRMIDDSSGVSDVDFLAKEFGLNFKFLERVFRDFTGINPKSYLRILRFQHAIHRYYTRRCSLTTLAYNSGYYDQAHFIRDVKCFTGLRPGEFFTDGMYGSDYFI